MKTANDMKAENGFGFTSGKKLFASQGIVVGNFEYRKAGAKDGSHNWPVLRVRFSDPHSTKFFEEDLNLRNAMSAADVKKLEGKTVVDFAGFWGTFIDRKIDAKTGEIVIRETEAEWPKVTELYLSDGTTFKPSGDKIEFGAVGYVA